VIDHSRGKNNESISVRTFNGLSKYEYTKFIGVFSTREKAELAIKKLSTKPGF